jgi:hypothetical protein
MAHWLPGGTARRGGRGCTLGGGILAKTPVEGKEDKDEG